MGIGNQIVIKGLEQGLKRNDGAVPFCLTQPRRRGNLLPWRKAYCNISFLTMVLWSLPLIFSSATPR